MPVLLYLNKEKIVILTGAGISAESGLSTFRDSGGLWKSFSVYEVATPEGWEANPEIVLEFYNQRRRKVALAQPNAAHLAVAKLEEAFDVTIVTQNVDNLHEKAGSTKVVHVHGEITKARSSADPALISDIGYEDIQLGDTCDEGSQLRPHIVWFGESVQNMEAAAKHVEEADKVLVIGTSLSVYPAAGLVDYAQASAEKVLVALEMDHLPDGFRFYQGKATEQIPKIIEKWMG
ncbi:MAG: NAD-dependent deacylase [Opitutales bacterium]|jgi:NAD-dependent deacetylase|nr:NAD-dependent deacylase [bacterium]MDG2166753.1 NAD-dependent deacylase [Opitutales bacterium]